MTVFKKELRAHFASFLVWSAGVGGLMALCVWMYPSFAGSMEDVSALFAGPPISSCMRSWAAWKRRRSPQTASSLTAKMLPAPQARAMRFSPSTYPSFAGSMEDVSALFAGMGDFSAAFGLDKLAFGSIMGFYGTECGNILGMGGAFFAALTGMALLAGEEGGRTAASPEKTRAASA